VQQLVKQRLRGTSDTEHRTSNIEVSTSRVVVSVADTPVEQSNVAQSNSQESVASLQNRGHETMSDNPIRLPSDQDASGRTFGAEELENLTAALRSGTLTSTKGTFVSQFEQNFASQFGSRFGHACSSGTAAIHTRPPGSRRLRRVTLPRHVRSPARRPGSAVERSLQPGTHRLHR
jgi:hypothetical protein